MPILWSHVFTAGIIPAVDEIVGQLGSESRAWVYQAHAGLIREVHVALYLSYFGTVTKNLYRDVFHGEDLHFRGRAIAIRHSGSFSDVVWSERKASKSAGCVVLNARSRGARIHLVRLDEINSALGLPVPSTGV